MAKPKRRINEEEKPDLITGIIIRSQSGEAEQDIANALGLSRHQVRQLKSSQEYVDLLRKQKEEAEKRIVSMIVPELESMVPAFLNGMRKNLDEGDASTLRLYAEVVGLKAKTETDQGPGNLTIVLPGANEEKVVDSTIVVPEES